MVKDINPQFFSFVVTGVINNVYSETTVPLPYPRFTTPAGRQPVIEVLKIEVETNDYSYINATGHGLFTTLSTTAGSEEAFLDNPHLFFKHREYLLGATAHFTSPDVYEYTDNNGKGLLLAVDNIYAGIQSAGWESSGEIPKAYFKIFYRFRNVSLAEYIGIVQSQQ